MKIALKDGMILIQDPNRQQEATIKSWGRRLMFWDRRNFWWEGFATMELLDKLAKMVPLPDPIEAERQKMHAVQTAVDTERNRPPEDVKPLVHYPVKEQMYIHQIRAANMALITFGIIKPPEKEGVQNGKT